MLLLLLSLDLSILFQVMYYYHILRLLYLSYYLLSILQMLGSMYLTLFAIGAITTATQWKQIHTTERKKILYTITFPVFMFTYIPISLTALFTKVEWKPIHHSVTARQVNFIKK